jgi:hypothetical protein
MEEKDDERMLSTFFYVIGLVDHPRFPKTMWENRPQVADSSK